MSGKRRPYRAKLRGMHSAEWIVNYKGEIMPLMEAARRAGLSSSTIHYRFKRAGRPWRVDAIVLAPPKPAPPRPGEGKHLKKMKEVLKKKETFFFEPGSWERVHLADAGKNGYAGGKDTTTYPVRVSIGGK